MSSSFLDDDHRMWSVSSSMPYSEPPWQTSLPLSSTPAIAASPARWGPESPTASSFLAEDHLLWPVPFSMPDSEPPWQTSLLGISSTPEIPVVSPATWWPESPTQMVTYNGEFLSSGNFPSSPDRPLSPLWNFSEVAINNSIPSPVMVHVHRDGPKRMAANGAMSLFKPAVVKLLKVVIQLLIGAPCPTSEKQFNLNRCGNDQHLGAQVRPRGFIFKEIQAKAGVVELFELEHDEALDAFFASLGISLSEVLVDLPELEHDEASHSQNGISLSEVCVERTETPKAVCIPGSENAKHSGTGEAANDSASTNAVGVSERNMFEKKCGISEGTFSFNVLKRHFSMKLDDAAESLHVSRSTLKRICRQHGIARWPSQRQSNLFKIAKSAKDILCSTNPAGNSNLHPNVAGPSQELNGTLACYSVSNVCQGKEICRLKSPGKQSNLDYCGNEQHGAAWVTPTHGSRARLVELTELEYDATSEALEASYIKNGNAVSGKHNMKKMLKGMSNITEVRVEHNETPRAVCIPGSENANKHNETGKAANDSPSTNAVAVSVSKTSEQKCGISERTIPIDVVKQHFSMKLDEAAENLHVSRSTLKRICRQHGIARWPSQRRYNLSEIAKSAKDILCRTTPAGNLNLHPNVAGPSEQQEQNATLACKLMSSVCHDKEGMTVSNHHVRLEKTPTRQDSVKGLEQASGDQPCEISHFTTGPLARTLTMKAVYGEVMIRFDFCLNSEISKLKEEVAKRLNLDTTSFDIKYLDNDNDWISIRCEEDLKQCVAICGQQEGNVIRLQIRKTT